MVRFARIPAGVKTYIMSIVRVLPVILEGSHNVPFSSMFTAQSTNERKPTNVKQWQLFYSCFSPVTVLLSRHFNLESFCMLILNFTTDVMFTC